EAALVRVLAVDEDLRGGRVRGVDEVVLRAGQVAPGRRQQPDHVVERSVLVHAHDDVVDGCGHGGPPVGGHGSLHTYETAAKEKRDQTFDGGRRRATNAWMRARASGLV